MKTPDIEIYLKKVPVDEILVWLREHFEVSGQTEKGDTLQLDLVFDGKTVNCTILEKAAHGGYTSVWFRANVTPWDDDEACARNAFEYFGAEVRCSRSGWQPEEDDEGQWLRLTPKGESIVNWRA
jgi:hypothetical protein